MSSRRTTTLITTCLALSLVAPGVALGGPLLSGYGAPGVGNQVILGATLLKGPPNGGSTGGGSSGGGGGESGLLEAQAAEAHRGPAARHHGSTSRSLPKKGRAGDLASTPVLRNASAHLPILGLSGEDLLYAILALGAVALAGLFTWQLMRTQDGRDATAAKGMRRNTRGIT